jgi:hypothetical protein
MAEKLRVSQVARKTPEIATRVVNQVRKVGMADADRG